MKRKNLKFFIVGTVVALAVGYLVYGATKNTGLYYLTVSELMSRKEVVNRPVRVSGEVMDGSIKWFLKKTSTSDRERICKFTITDGKKALEVNYEGILPNTFRPDTEVVVEGVYRNDGIFKAKKVIAKCPSKYEIIK